MIKRDILYSSDIYFYYKAVNADILGAYIDREGKCRCHIKELRRHKKRAGRGIYKLWSEINEDRNHHKPVVVFEIVSSCIGGDKD